MNIGQALRRKWGRVPQFSLNQPPCYLKSQGDLKMRLAVIAVTGAALIAVLTTGVSMNNACKTDRGLWWCAPAKAHVSMN